MIAQYSFSGTKQTSAPKLPAHKPLTETALSDVLRAMIANDDRQRSKTKLRGEVRGGGKKPWRQKGTGRARAGSNRSPLWRGGGITFGPDGTARPKKHVPAKVRRAALLSVLAGRDKDGTLTVVSGKPSLDKTKAGAAFYAKLSLAGSTLFVVAADELAAVAGLRNLGSVDLTTVADISAADLARHANVAISTAAWDVLVGGKAVTPARPTTKAPAKSPAATKAAPKPAAKKPAKRTGDAK